MGLKAESISNYCVYGNTVSAQPITNEFVFKNWEVGIGTRQLSGQPIHIYNTRKMSLSLRSTPRSLAISFTMATTSAGFSLGCGASMPWIRKCRGGATSQYETLATSQYRWWVPTKTQNQLVPSQGTNWSQGVGPQNILAKPVSTKGTNQSIWVGPPKKLARPVSTKGTKW